MKIFAYALREYDELPYMQELSEQLGFEFDWSPDYPNLDNVTLAQGATGVSIITNPIDAALLDAFAALGVKGLATRSIGYDHIAMDRARKLGIRVATAVYPPDGVADYAVMLMLMALRKVKFIQQKAVVQDFTLKGKIGRELGTCTVGIVGTGKIGAAVAQRLAGFGCKMYAFDPYPNEELAGLAEYVSLDELLARCDVITLHAPATEENFHMLGARELALLQPGAVLANTARGSLVDSAALIQALESGQVGAAALDTIENEAGMYYLDCRGKDLNNPEKDALEAMPNVIVTSHMAFYTAENVRHMVDSTTRALVDFANGGFPLNEAGARLS